MSDGIGFGANARTALITRGLAEMSRLGAALEYVSALGLNNIAEYEQNLMHYALPQLESVPDLTLYGLQNRLGVSGHSALNMWSGIVFSITFLFSAIASPFWGGLANRRKQRRTQE